MQVLSALEVPHRAGAIDAERLLEEGGHLLVRHAGTSHRRCRAPLSCRPFVYKFLPFIDKNGSRARGDAEARQLEVVRGATQSTGDSIFSIGICPILSGLLLGPSNRYILAPGI